ncbi:hypothetical protein KX729_29575 [Rhizobium sp. XQZ8]|uniref:hypothetical protein n=1 Tax=Rhizobium populisoli TaxID=2859785 RepID=UPI001CA5D18C|nr:hypothetical protein [Rhizobium populisoli]MBW6425561.1 hypothetical protein [Rhizobium populisoli]
MNLIVEGKIGPFFLIANRIGLEEGHEAYKTYRDKKEGCAKASFGQTADSIP